MQSLFTVLLSILVGFVNLFGPLFPPCEKCDSKCNIICEECDGEGFFYNAEYDVMVVCGQCGAYGEVSCPECSTLAKIYYSVKASLEDSDQ